LIEKIRSQLSSQSNEFEDYYVLDSMPLEVYKTARASRSKFAKKRIDRFNLPPFWIRREG